MMNDDRQQQREAEGITFHTTTGTIPRETLHEILREMLKDTLVPISAVIDELYDCTKDDVVDRLVPRILSDAVILACVRDCFVHRNGGYANVCIGNTVIVYRPHHQESRLTFHGTGFEKLGSIGVNQLCAEVRAALGVSHE